MRLRAAVSVAGISMSAHKANAGRASGSALQRQALALKSFAGVNVEIEAKLK